MHTNHSHILVDLSIFADFKKVSDPSTIAILFVPENKKSSEQVWANSARKLLEDIIVITQKTEGTMVDVARTITQSSFQELCSLLEKHNSPSKKIVNLENKKGAESVRIILSEQPAIRFFSGTKGETK